MAVHLWFGRILSVFLLALLGLAGTARADHFLTHPAATPQVVAAAPDGSTLSERGAEIKIKRDANVYITPRNIPKNDRFLKAYSADKAVRSTGTAAPGLLDIATEAYRTQAAAATATKAYSLADAMRDAVWRKKTAAKLKTLMTARNTCPEAEEDSGAAKPSIGLGNTC